MDMQELRKLIYRGENVDVEWDKRVSVSKFSYEPYFAFANLKGGRIIIGVKEDKIKRFHKSVLYYMALKF